MVSRSRVLSEAVAVLFEERLVEDFEGPFVDRLERPARQEFEFPGPGLEGVAIQTAGRQNRGQQVRVPRVETLET